MKRYLLTVVAAIGLLMSAQNTALACDFCLLSQGISPLDTMKGTGIKVVERYTLLDQVFQGTSKQTNPGAKEDHWTTELTGFYGVRPEFMVMAVVPYKKGTTSGELDMTTDPAGLDTAGAGSASGIGDVALLGRYTLLKQENPDTTNVMAALVGIKFATGKTDAKTTDGAEFLDSHLQPGTGSTDYLLGLSYSHSLTRFSLSANLLGTIATAGKFGDLKHEFGNSLNYDVTGKYRVHPVAFSPARPQYFVALGVNGELREREKIEGETVPDTGGNTTYLSPGVQLVLAPHWVVEATYQWAILHNLYGTQLGETYKAIGGVTYLF
jgi:outer membrane putative beta-barrel porin/alpha-amylase